MEYVCTLAVGVLPVRDLLRETAETVVIVHPGNLAATAGVKHCHGLDIVLRVALRRQSNGYGCKYAN